MGLLALIELRLQGVVLGSVDIIGCRAYRFDDDIALLIVEAQKALYYGHLHFVEIVPLSKLRQEQAIRVKEHRTLASAQPILVHIIYRAEGF